MTKTRLIVATATASLETTYYKAQATDPRTIAMTPLATLATDAAPVNCTIPVVDTLLVGRTLPVGWIVEVALLAPAEGKKPLQSPLLQVL